MNLRELCLKLKAWECKRSSSRTNYSESLMTMPMKTMMTLIERDKRPKQLLKLESQIEIWKYVRSAVLCKVSLTLMIDCKCISKVRNIKVTLRSERSLLTYNRRDKKIDDEALTRSILLTVVVARLKRKKLVELLLRKPRNISIIVLKDGVLAQTCQNWTQFMIKLVSSLLTV